MRAERGGESETRVREKVGQMLGAPEYLSISVSVIIAVIARVR